MMVALIPFAPFKVPFFALIAWSVGYEYFERRFLYKLLFVYSLIFTFIMFPFSLTVLEGIESILITPFIQGQYPMILGWFFWIIFFTTSIATQWIITAFGSYIVWQFTGKWFRRLPNYVSKVIPNVG